MNLFFGYLDPGSGSYLFQMIVAGCVAGYLFIKQFWLNIILFIKNIFNKQDKNIKDE